MQGNTKFSTQVANIRSLRAARFGCPAQKLLFMHRVCSLINLLASKRVSHQLLRFVVFDTTAGVAVAPQEGQLVLVGGHRQVGRLLRWTGHFHSLFIICWADMLQLLLSTTWRVLGVSIRPRAHTLRLLAPLSSRSHSPTACPRLPSSAPPM